MLCKLRCATFLIEGGQFTAYRIAYIEYILFFLASPDHPVNLTLQLCHLSLVYLTLPRKFQ